MTADIDIIPDDMGEIEVGQTAHLNPSDNRRAQLASIGYGLLSALIGAVALMILVFVATRDVAFSAFVGGIPGAVIGFGLSIYYVPVPRNAVPRSFGSFDERWLGPSGLQCYLLRPIGNLFFQAAVGERQLNAVRVNDAESKQGTRWKVTFKVNQYYVRWPLPYVRAIESTGNPDAAQVVAVELLSSVVRKFVNLMSDKQLLQVEDMHMLLSDLLSGEKDEINVPVENGDDPDHERKPFVLSDGNPAKTVRRRLKQVGIYIPNGGVVVIDINEPDDIADAKAEERQAESRNRAIETRVAHRKKLQDENPGVNVSEIEENVLVDAGLARMNIIRGSGGNKPGDFTTGAAVQSNQGGASERKQSDEKKGSEGGDK